MVNELVPVIGIEVHVEPYTQSKMFCDCSANHFNAEPNTQVCPVCLGLPGALPVPNIEALRLLVKLGNALNCTINEHSYFERKNYFYPDLPKGYQISQYRAPLCTNGSLEITLYNKETKQVTKKTVRINRAHMEEDTAKLKHRGGETLIDFNRSGVPLIEIVSEADMSSAEEAKAYLKEIAKLLKWIGISSASMEKGTMRLEANVSIQVSSKFQVQSSKLIPIGDYPLNPRVELKNINSFNFVEKAVNYEIERQTKVLQSGSTLAQETRGWNEEKGESFVQRTKETSSDYRYFPEPDIPPISTSSVIPAKAGIHKNTSRFGSTLTRTIKYEDLLPRDVQNKLEEEYKLPYQYILVIGESLEMFRLFEETVALSKGILSNQEIAGYIVNNKIDPAQLDPVSIIKALEKKNSEQISDESVIEEAVRKAISTNPAAVEDYKKGKEASLHFLVGQVMKLTKGKAAPAAVIELLKNILK